MNAIVLGANHNNALGLVRSLGETNNKVYLLLYKDIINFVALSKYVTNCFFVDMHISKVEQIINICKTLDGKPFLFSTSDEDAAYINDNANLLAPYCYFEGGIGINEYRNKDVSNILAKQCGLHVPKTYVLHSCDQVIDGVAIPAIVKANNSIRGGKSLLHRIENRDELYRLLKKIPSNCYPVQVQEYIKKEYELMLLGCSLSAGAVVCCPVAQRKYRFYPNEYNAGSFSCSIDPSCDPKLVSLQEKVSLYMKKIKYTGLFSAEFVYKDGDYYFCEINLRNDGTSYIATKSGYNLPNILCSYYNNGKANIAGVFSPSYYMVNISDFGNVLKKRLSIWTWLKDFNKANCYSHYNKRDIVPYIGFLLSFIIKKIVKK